MFLTKSIQYDILFLHSIRIYAMSLTMLRSSGDPTRYPNSDNYPLPPPPPTVLPRCNASYSRRAW